MKSTSPPPDASGTARGLVNLLAQTFAGVKTFTSALIASAGVQVASLWNTNGTGSTDVAVKVGTSVASASVNAAAEIFRVACGLGGGSESGRLAVYKGAQVEGFELGAPGVAGRIKLDNSVGWSFQWSTNSIVIDGANVTMGNSSNGNIMRWGSNTAIWVRGTDDSATVGNGTVSKPSGIGQFASGQTTCTITNTLVPAVATRRVRIEINWHGDHGAARSWVVQTAGGGSFVVNLSGAAVANTIFSWAVFELL